MTEPYRFGLIGHHIAYSRSTQIFNAIFTQCKAAGSFELFDIAPDQFTHKVQELFRSGVQAVSVTIPHKNRIIGELDEVDPVALTLDAVNSVCVRGGHLYGFNTDVYGFAQPLLAMKDKLTGEHAVILGYGGSAKAVVYSLYHDFGVRQFSVIGRDPAKLAEFKRVVSELLPEAALSCYQERAHLEIPPHAILVNCTPLAGWNHPDETPFGTVPLMKDAIYCDLNYNPTNIAVAQAKAAGMESFDGSRMLVAQAVRSFYLWTGIQVDPAPIYPLAFPEHRS